MVDDDALEAWFCEEVLPLERRLEQFIRRNWRVAEDVRDLTHDVYELAIAGARKALPYNTQAFMLMIARNHLINRAKRQKIVSFEMVADLETMEREVDVSATERHLVARDALRRTKDGIEQLSPRVREIVLLRKVDGLNTRETAARLGIGIDAVERQLSMGMKALADFMLGGSGRIVRQKAAVRRRKEGRI
ncbi:RNA polymerase sigma factor [Sphingomonas melonis]|uniref:RNA polymerase sigma-70 factor (ECF subfamily) n=1 Tax=Sphingomonas melonis TaxID=152682 RepID=A0A7Y9FLM3_9SPHN|nr:RNA polymerase sigma factor [Sphingomonas melonis]NYD89152.1 RNA polymerase sigma-70 factor (ECF subfamily) [Sphingomonas melonis]